MTRRTSGNLIDELVRKAEDAFRAAMHDAADEELWRLHAALEKATFSVVRGSWGKVPTEADATSLRATACPLTALVVGKPKAKTDIQFAQGLMEHRLQRFGYRTSDFYDVWDRGLISRRRLLKIVDEATTQRALRPGKPRSMRRSTADTA